MTTTLRLHPEDRRPPRIARTGPTLSTLLAFLFALLASASTTAVVLLLQERAATAERVAHVDPLRGEPNPHPASPQEPTAVAVPNDAEQPEVAPAPPAEPAAPSKADRSRRARRGPR